MTDKPHNLSVGQCLLSRQHEPHAWWYTAEGGGHMLDPQIAEREAREEREKRISGKLTQWWCQGLAADLPEPEQTQPEPHPNIALLNKSAAERMTIADFLEWCSQQGYHLGEYVETHFTASGGEARLYPVTKSHDSLAMAYLGVDEQALERERRSVLDALRRIGNKS